MSTVEATWLSGQIKTESDVEQKFIYPLLASNAGFSFPSECIKTKKYLAPTNIDKGAGKRVGYYPDYQIVESGLPVMVVEAKPPSESIDKGFREALMYAGEINKRYPEGINPVKFVVATNGHKFRYSPADSEDYTELECANCIPGLAHFQEAVATLGREALSQHACDVRARLHNAHRNVPIRLIGGPARQKNEVEPNAFAKDIVSLLNKYFDPDSTRGNRSIIKDAYCASSQTTKYDKLLESLLGSDLKKAFFKSFQDVETTKKHAHAFDTAVAKATQSDDNSPLMLVIGSVGAGKSMFIDRYYYHLQSHVIQNETKWAFIDINKASNDLDGIDRWFAEEFLRDFRERNGIADFLSYENLCRYFAPKLRDLRDGPLKLLYESDQAEADRIVSAKLLEWSEDPEILLEGVLRYYQGDVGLRIVVFFDNGDRRDRDQQLALFQSVQHFRSKYKTISILSLRDETYDRYQDEPPLDAFFKPYLFRIHPPRFLDVIKKRLRLIIADITKAADTRLEYTLPNGIVLEYPNTDLGKYLVSIYQAVFSPDRRIRLVLEALAGHDVRRALQMFSHILMSGHIDVAKLLESTYGDRLYLTDSRILRILMRTRYEHFADEHGYVRNLLDVPEHSKTATNFLLTDVLKFLIDSRKQSHELRIQGYRQVHVVIEHCTKYGYSTEDTLWALERLLESGLVVADHQRPTGISRDDHVKVTASGFFHLRRLMKMPEYFIGVACQVPVRDRDMAHEIASTCNVGGNEKDYRYDKWYERLVALQACLYEEQRVQYSIQHEDGIESSSTDVVEDLNLCSDRIKNLVDRFEESRQRRHSRA